MSWIEYEPDPRIDCQIAELGKCEGSDDTISQEKTGRGVDDISTVGRIANETLSSRRGESSVFVAGPTRCVVFDEGIGERHAEADGTID